MYKLFPEYSGSHNFTYSIISRKSPQVNRKSLELRKKLQFIPFLLVQKAQILPFPVLLPVRSVQ